MSRARSLPCFVWVCCAFFGSLSGCMPKSEDSKAAPHFEALPQPPVRVAVGPFSFLPPDEPGWRRKPSAQGQFMAGRFVEGEDETYGLQAFLLADLPADASEDQLVELLRAVAQGSQKQGLVGTQSDVAAAPLNGARCARMEFKTLDSQPRRASGRTDPLALAAISYACAHPRQTTRGLMLVYSEQAEPGHEDPRLGEKAAAVAATLEFLDGP